MVVGSLLSYWEGNFSGAMLNFAGVVVISFWSNYSDLTRPISPKKVAFWKGNPLISGKSRLVKYDSIWPDYFTHDELFWIEEMIENDPK